MTTNAENAIQVQPKPPHIPRKDTVNNAEALKLVNEGILTKTQAVKQGIGTWAGMQRTEVAREQGFDEGQVGRSRKLCEADRNKLVQWIQSLLDDYGAIYQDTVLILVCSLSNVYPLYICILTIFRLITSVNNIQLVRLKISQSQGPGSMHSSRSATNSLLQMLLLQKLPERKLAQKVTFSNSSNTTWN